MNETVIQVIPTQDFKVYVYFADGKIKLFDMGAMITKGVFQKIADAETFVRLCTVLNGALAWDVGGNFDPTRCLDVDPITIYQTGVDVADPLAGLAS